MVQAKETILNLKSLSYKDPVLKSIRADIKNSIYTIKSRRPESNLPKLKFYRYRLRGGDNFWSVLSRCSLDMDTLMSVNGIESPAQVGPGTTLFIPNMRGIVLPGKNSEAIKRVMVREKIDNRYVLKVNGTTKGTKKFLFIPCGKVTKMQRSLFLGSAFLSPIKKGHFTSGFGTRQNPFHRHRREFHKGVDIGCPMNTKIFAARAGKVIFAGWQSGYGKVVVLDHGGGYKSYYGHLNRILVKRGEAVRALQVIAKSGNTGRSTGPHLHFEIRKNNRAINPKGYVRFKVNR